MIRLLVLTVSIHAILASQEWENFKTDYQKVYQNAEEENFRREIFVKNLQRIEEHNKRYEEGLLTYSIGVNKFADLTRDELFSSNTAPKNDREEVPDSIDWRDRGVVTPVGDQVMCETCWAFAVVSTIESHMAIYMNTTVNLSQQNLADCVDPTFTCQRDMPRDMLDRTYQYIIDNKGIDTYESYPYERQVGSCRFSTENIGATISGYANITEGDEDELKTVVGTIGPVAVAVTTDLDWALYRRGVYYDPECMNEDEIFNHAVVVVGYGTEDGQDYWLVRNSWGPDYGDGGYIKMARNRDNNCGIASIARYPLL